MLGDQREAAIYRITTKGLESVCRCEYAIYYVCIPQDFRIGPKTALQGGVSVTSDTIKFINVMHLSILRVNLLTRFFVFLSVLSALHESDGGIYIFRVFLYLVLSKLSSWRIMTFSFCF